MKKSNYRVRDNVRGFGLIELLVVMVIVAIVASIAYPSYTQFVVKSKRSAAQSMLLQVADRQQQFFMDNKRYAASLTDLNYPASPFSIGSEGDFLASGDEDSVYSISLTDVAATTFTVQAVPQLVQASRDTECGTYTYDHTGAKGADGDVGTCW